MTDALPLVFFTMVALCPGCGRHFLVGVAETDVRDLVAGGTKPAELADALIAAHRSRALQCATCVTAATN